METWKHAAFLKDTWTLISVFMMQCPVCESEDAFRDFFTTRDSRTNTASGGLSTEHILYAVMCMSRCVCFMCKTVTGSLSLQRSDSEPPGMILNVIIKHVLQTAPAISLYFSLTRSISLYLSPSLSLASGPPGTPSERGRAGEGGREGRKGGDTGGARMRGWSVESSKSEGVTVTSLDSFTPARGCC